MYFRYGTMNSSKSMNLIASVHNYESKGDKVVVIKPSLDTRSANGFIESRVGTKTECIDISLKDSILTCVKTEMDKKGSISCVFVDECQFLTQEQAFELISIADTMRIPVIAYGLRTDFRGILFVASNVLLSHADKIEEIKTVCHVKGCKRKAMYNQRVVNGKPVFKGDSILVGDTISNTNIRYEPKCRFHFMADMIDSQKGGNN
ncbi:thymidine kinase [Virgibacillus sp. M23]|uniref:thymidine kinase n=1 Tax=Virgibacillus sp. M23 TaxID=3079030 RepID=UPI002A908CEC|nr:thymidine kinase [Virgibacillus sp. M23]MDY7043603.1 thymidine kinase [Virgibacillus sp. M23]